MFQRGSGVDGEAEHSRKRATLQAALVAAASQGRRAGLRKSTSNLFRKREGRGKVRLDARKLNRVLSIDAGQRLADVEGMTTYEALVEETLRHGLLPLVVPQLKTITAGGAVSGLGIESSSFRYGLVHDTVAAMDVLLGDGRIVRCSRSENRDLFFGFPNSYGTLGYALRLTLRLAPARRYVHVRHVKFTDAGRYFAEIEAMCRRDGLEYLDGTVFDAAEMYITAGESCDEAPFASDYTYLRIYYGSIQQRAEDWLTAGGYIWRWDTDWFWCSKQFHVQIPAIRWLCKPVLNSRSYQAAMRTGYALRPHAGGVESVIQDVDIPVEHAPDFLDFLLREIRVTPIWICPVRAPGSDSAFDLYALEAGKLYINFGFWGVVKTGREDGHLNRKIERKAMESRGKKGLYSTSYYDRSTFREIYNGRRYDELKAKYDSGGVFPDLYEKCVARY
jgi:FAD/FMN-containing dehydrogenase